VWHFQALYVEVKTKKFGYNEIIVSNMKSIIVKILRNSNVTGKKISHWDKVSLQFEIEDILFNEFSTISVIDLAKRLNMSVRELQRYLNKNYNKTFNELKKEIKMSFAANKLEYTNISINELSELVGFSTSEHFSYSFKRYYGESPITFRKKELKSINNKCPLSHYFILNGFLFAKNLFIINLEY
jgi:AraC-like DNA-binding protein